MEDQPTTNQLTTEELKYSGDRAPGHQPATNNVLKVWQNLDPFGGRPMGGTVEAMLTEILVICTWLMKRKRYLLYNVR